MSVELANTHEETLSAHGYSQEDFNNLKDSLKSEGFGVKNINGCFFATLDGNASDLDFVTSTDAWMFIDENKNCGIF